jgi:hypothetical protein
VGAAVGAVVGGVVGGLAGKGVAESVNPTVEHGFWRDNFSTRPYAKDATYDEYAPAYQYGWESASTSGGRSFDELEPSLRTGWDKAKGESKLEWDRAREAARDSWNRVTTRSSGGRSASDANTNR